MLLKKKKAVTKKIHEQYPLRKYLITTYGVEEKKKKNKRSPLVEKKIGLYLLAVECQIESVNFAQKGFLLTAFPES